MNRGFLFLILLGVALPAAASQDEVETLIEKLADDDIRVREEAGRKLIQRGAEVRERIRKLLSSGDEEVRARARFILDSLPLKFELLREVTCQCFAFSPYGKEVIVGREGSLEILNVETGKARLQIDKAGTRVRFLAWGDKSPYVENSDGLCPVDLSTVKVLEPLATRWPLVNVEGMQFDTSGDALISTEKQLWILLARGQVANLPNVCRGVMKEDGGLIVGMNDAKNPHENPEMWTFVGQGKWKASEVFKIPHSFRWMVAPPSLARITVGSKSSPELAQLNPENFRETARKDLKDGNVTALSVRGDGRWLLVGTKGGSVQILDESRLEFLGKISVGDAPRRIESTKDGAYVGVAAGDSLKIYKRQ